MARLARVVAVDVARLVTRRGNRRDYILSSEAERMVYLDLARQAVRLYPLSLIGYCLVSNYLHLIVIPHRADAVAPVFKRALDKIRRTGMPRTPPVVMRGRAASTPVQLRRN